MIEREERRWVAWFAVVALAITAIPYLLGYAVQGDHWIFSGFVFGVEDGNTYIAKILTGYKGDWLFRSPYTGFPQHGVINFLPYILLGKLIAYPGAHEQAVALFQLFRLGAGYLAILATYELIALFVQKVPLRRLGLVLATFGGGLGWLLVLIGKGAWLGSMPVEFYSPEAFGFLEIYGLPHLSLARAFLFWALIAFIGYVREVESRPVDARCSRRWLPATQEEKHAILKIGGYGILALLCQGITGILLWVILGLYVLGMGIYEEVNARRDGASSSHRWLVYLKVAFWAGLVVSPLAFYNLLVYQIDPYLKAWVAQSSIPSPNPLHYLAAYGMFLPFTFIGAVRLWKSNPWKNALIIFWLCALPVLLYIPFSFQRRFAEGIWVVIVILALVFWDQTTGEGGKARSMIFAWILSVFALISTVFLVFGGLMVASAPAKPVFIPKEQQQVYLWLAEHAAPDGIVLTAYDSGNALPAYAPLRVINGLQPESKDWKTIQPEIVRFFQVGVPDAEKTQFLDRYHIQYVLYSPDEKKLGPWDPADARFLIPAASFGDYSVYQYEHH